MIDLSPKWPLCYGHSPQLRLSRNLRNENNIFHDELGEVNDAFFFRDFCEEARRHGLQYLAEGDYVQPTPPEKPQEPLVKRPEPEE